MVITYHGGQCFKVTFGDTTLVFNPISKKSKLPAIKFGADIAFISLNHADFDGVAEVTYGSKEPFVVNGPGEYEVGDVKARGYGIQTKYENVDKYNTVYTVTLEGINMLFLGSLSDENISPEILGELGNVDIIFVPVGGGDVLDVPAASKLATKLEARVIIPMHYDKNALTAFLKEEGSDNGAPQDKLTLKKKDLLEMQGEVIILKN